ncbi:MAG: hypothetical protein ACTSW1_00130 [Candidatus Hodarchaeales archaeon]
MFDSLKVMITKKFILPSFMKIIQQEKNLSENKHAIKSIEQSPERFEIVLESIKLNEGKYSSPETDIGLLKTMTRFVRNKSFSVKRGHFHHFR